MSGGWREKLRGRFRSAGADRLQVVTRLLEERGEGEAERRAQALRELHTLKGEARMLGFGALNELAHAIEGALAGAGADAGAGDNVADASVLAREAVAVMLRALSGAISDEAADAELVAMQQRVTLRFEDAGAAPMSLRPMSLPPASLPPVSVAPSSLAPVSLAPSSVVPISLAPLSAVPSSRSPSSRTPSSRTPSSAGTPSTHRRKSGRTERWVRVRARDVDKLCESLAELERSFRQLAASARGGDDRRARSAERRALIESCERAMVDFDAVSEAAWAFRMTPLEPSLEEACQLARQLAESQGKRLRAVVRCGAAEVERDVLEALWEPLLHLVRNAVDHGIEMPLAREAKAMEATLTIDAEASGAMIILHVTDDGRGIDVFAVRAAAVARGLVPQDVMSAMSDAEAIDLIFQHGFSTRVDVTEISGRGLGLDIVRDVVESLGGSVSVSTEVGRGARFTLEVPASVSKDNALVVACGDHLYALPGLRVLEVLRAPSAERADDASGPAILWRAERLPLASLCATLGEPEAAPGCWIVVVAGPSSRCAFTVPEVMGDFQVLRRPADALVAQSGFVSASALLDDGRLVLVLSVGGLVRRARPETLLVGSSSAPAGDLEEWRQTPTGIAAQRAG